MKKLRENKKFIVLLYIFVAVLPFLIGKWLGSTKIPIFTYKLFRPYINHFKILMLFLVIILGKFVFKFSYKFRWRAFLKTLILLSPFIVFLLYQHWQMLPWFKMTFTDYYLKKPIFISLLIMIIDMLHEEFVSRGFLQNLAQRYFIWKTPLKTNIFAVLLTGLVFGLFHLTNLRYSGRWLNIYPVINQVIYATGFGCLFGSVYLITKDIWGLVLIHYWYDIPFVIDQLLYWDAPWKNHLKVYPFNPRQFGWAVGQLVVEVALALLYLYIYDKRKKRLA